MILLRDDCDSRRFFGRLLDDQDHYFCETIEHATLHIDEGSYLCRIRFSPSHGYAVFGLVGVPGRSDIEIHPGNDTLDTRGCILIGDRRGTVRVGDETYPAVLNSRLTFQHFMEVRGCPGFRSLLSWDAVRNWALKYPTLETFPLTVRGKQAT